MKKILIAGATGYLGQHLVKELKQRGYWVIVLIRKESQKKLFENVDEFFIGQITQSETIQQITRGIDWVMTTVGITRQKDGLTYMDVDYQGNANLLQEALKSRVEKFLYVSAINGDKLRHLKIFEAKEMFVDELKASGLNYVIMRPNGFFSDMRDFLNMAKGGRVYLFGDGHQRLNPIHGADLAKVCVDKMVSGEKEPTVGGPEIFTQNELAALALRSWGKKTKITHLPDWIRKFTIWIVRTFTSSITYGPIEFFLTAMALENIATSYGNHKLEDFFKEEVKKLKENE
ncbi:MAG: SDR family oxidoreductase [Bacteroidia bacterium]